MNFSVLTYNVLFNKAFLKLDSLINKYHPDIICLQEINTNQENLKKLIKYNYRLADYANSFIQFGNIFGVATFFNPEKFTFVNSESANFSLSISEIFSTLLQLILGVNKPKTVLKTDFVHKKSKKELFVYNAHLMFIATNALRISHIKQAISSLHIDKKSPMIVCGDFNYFPYSRKKLEKVMNQFKLIEATKNILPTMKFSTDGKYEQFNLVQRFFIKLINRTRIASRIKTDYVFYKNLRFLSSKKEEINLSDHYPIISSFKF